MKLDGILSHSVLFCPCQKERFDIQILLWKSTEACLFLMKVWLDNSYLFTLLSQFEIVCVVRKKNMKKLHSLKGSIYVSKILSVFLWGPGSQFLDQPVWTLWLICSSGYRQLSCWLHLTNISPDIFFPPSSHLLSLSSTWLHFLTT